MLAKGTPVVDSIAGGSVWVFVVVSTPWWRYPLYNEMRTEKYDTRRKWWLVARPVLRSCNQSALIVDRITCTSCETVPIGKTNRMVSQPVARLVCPQSYAIHWWYDPARLVARSWTTCLRPIWNRRSCVLNMTTHLAATKFARTITHDVWDQSHDLSMIYLWFVWFCDRT